MRPIDADALKAEWNEPTDWMDRDQVLCHITWFRAVIDNMPTISPKTGRWTNSEMDEAFRIASEVRIAVGCNTAKECWELARNGEIQRVKHGRWIEYPDVLQFPDVLDESYIGCSQCKNVFSVIDNCTERFNYCPNCGARMDKE